LEFFITKYEETFYIFTTLADDAIAFIFIFSTRMETAWMNVQ